MESLINRNMRVFAHRGDWELFPENSEAAIVSSIKNGFDVELDIRFTADKQIVLMHDSNLQRLFDVNQNISELFFNDIKDLRYISNQSHHPVLFDDLAPILAKAQRDFAIHFKQEDQNEDNCLILAKLFKENDLYRNCFLFNLSLDSCHLLRTIDCNIKLSILISDNKFEPFVFLFEEVEDRNDLYDIIWAAEYENLYNQGLIDRAHQLRKKIIAVSPELHRNLGHPKALDGYTQCWQDLFLWKADGICTDYPKKYVESIIAATANNYE